MLGRATAWFTAMLAAGAVIGVAPAAAQTGQPRQTYSDLFTTDQPGASAGRALAVDWFDPENRDGKPHSFSSLRLELAQGARFDTSAVPHCTASDAELMAQGASACPEGTVVGVDETIIDTGFPEPNRFLTSDFVFLNNEDELILLSTVRENGARVVLRGRIRDNTLAIDVPPLPGTPPDGGAATRERATFYPRSTVRDGRRRNYITTPPTCPSSGYWVNKVTYAYRDGVTQTTETRSPCRRASAQSPGAGRGPAADRSRPSVSALGMPRGCVRRSFRARLRVADASAVRSVRVRLDRRTLASSRRKRLVVRVPVRRLRAGVHAIRVDAVDASGNRGRRTFRFRRCRR
jgi:hypothetical protein